LACVKEYESQEFNKQWLERNKDLISRCGSQVSLRFLASSPPSCFNVHLTQPPLPAGIEVSFYTCWCDIVEVHRFTTIVPTDGDVAAATTNVTATDTIPSETVRAEKAALAPPFGPLLVALHEELLESVGGDGVFGGRLSLYFCDMRGWHYGPEYHRTFE
jgi:hypothetical protein